MNETRPFLTIGVLKAKNVFLHHAPSYVVDPLIREVLCKLWRAMLGKSWFAGIVRISSMANASRPASNHNSCRNSRCQNAIEWQLPGPAKVQLFDAPLRADVRHPDAR